MATDPGAVSGATAQITITAGLGPYELGNPVQGYFTFDQTHDTGDTFRVSVDNGADKEIVDVTYTLGEPSTLSRDTLVKSTIGGDFIDWPTTGQRVIRELDQGDTNSTRIWAPSVSLAGPAVGGRFPNDGEELFVITFTYNATLPINLTGSRGFIFASPTSAVTFPIKKNGISIGTANVGAGGFIASFTFASAVTFAPGDYLAFYAPSPQDTTLADFSFTFLGTFTP